MERTLSKNESRIILDLEWRGQRTIRLADMRDALGGNAGYARFLAHQLVKKGWFERLRPGVYQLIPADRGREGVADTNPLSAGAVLADPYFFSFGTACTHHGLTEQAFAEVYLACKKRRRPQTIRGKRYILVYLRSEWFFGFDQSVILGQPVQMATCERALLDALDRPEYAGGIGEVSRIVHKAATVISWAPLLDGLERWRESALVQRLGYFLDLHRADVPAEVRRQLEELVRPGVKVHLGARKRWGSSGRLVRPWNVIENVSPDVLVERNQPRRRRVNFPVRERS